MLLLFDGLTRFYDHVSKDIAEKIYAQGLRDGLVIATIVLVVVYLFSKELVSNKNNNNNNSQDK